MNLKKIVLAGSLLVSVLYAGDYDVDLSHSNIGFKVKHLMLSNAKGTFDKFTGNYEYDEKNGVLKSLNGNIYTNSINTKEKDRDKHLQAEDMLDTSKFPNIFFSLTKVQDDFIYGNITIKGITKNIKLNYINNGHVKDPWGNYRSAFELSGKINRKDFNLTYNKVLETGGLIVGDVVNLSIEIEGIMKK
jgi:polyisoprenoid-binding protein YceI